MGDPDSGWFSFPSESFRSQVFDLLVRRANDHASSKHFEVLLWTRLRRHALAGHQLLADGTPAAWLPAVDVALVSDSDGSSIDAMVKRVLQTRRHLEDAQSQPSVTEHYELASAQLSLATSLANTMTFFKRNGNSAPWLLHRGKKNTRTLKRIWQSHDDNKEELPLLNQSAVLHRIRESLKTSDHSALLPQSSLVTSHVDFDRVLYRQSHCENVVPGLSMERALALLPSRQVDGDSLEWESSVRQKMAADAPPSSLDATISVRTDDSQYLGMTKDKAFVKPESKQYSATLSLPTAALAVVSPALFSVNGQVFDLAKIGVRFVSDTQDDKRAANISALAERLSALYAGKLRMNRINGAASVSHADIYFMLLGDKIATTEPALGALYDEWLDCFVATLAWKIFGDTWVGTESDKSVDLGAKQLAYMLVLASSEWVLRLRPRAAEPSSRDVIDTLERALEPVKKRPQIVALVHMLAVYLAPYVKSVEKRGNRS